jgi:uncharacterized membrane protein
MAESAQQRKWSALAVNAGVAALLAIVLAPFAPQILARARTAASTGPDWRLWMDLPWVVQLHILAAVAALLIDAVILLRPKGRGLHKALGWSWVVAMGTTAVSSLFMTGLNGNFYSLIHLLSGWTIIALPMAIFAIRNRKVETHRRAMTGMFLGGLLIAGALTFIPGRFMFEFFFG